MTGRAFLDTNVLVYATLAPDFRSDLARELLSQRHVISVQVLNEFANVARGKLRRSWPDVVQALSAIRILCLPPRPLTVAMHEAALSIAARLHYQLYDAMIIAAALEAGCVTLYSEDLQHGQVIERRLTIRNPFARQR
jgi:predicted nucleic acid-binding protein